MAKKKHMGATVSVRVPESMKLALEDIADRQGQDVGQLVRDILKNAIAQRKQEPKDNDGTARQGNRGITQ